MQNIKSAFGLKIAILSLSFLLMLRMTISPALAEIGKAFPAVSQETLMIMLVLPSLVAIVSGFLAGIVSHKFRTKLVLYVALVLFLIGGMGPIFVHDFRLIMLCRVILGVGIGFFLPYSAGLIATFYEGRERNQMLGFQSASCSIGNVITSLVAGLLAVLSWNLPFLIYGFAFISLLLIVVYLPEPQKVGLDGRHGGRSVAVNKGVTLVCVGVLLYSILYFAFFGYLAFIVDASGLGDAKVSGLATMLMTLGALIMGLSFGQIVRFMKSYALFLALILNAAGFGILSVANSLGELFAGSFIVGLGFGLLMPYAMMRLNEASDRAAVNFSNALFMTAVNIGTAAAPKILVAVGQIFGNEDGQFIFHICTICMFGSAVIYLVYSVGTALRSRAY